MDNVWEKYLSFQEVPRHFQVGVIKSNPPTHSLMARANHPPPYTHTNLKTISDQLENIQEVNSLLINKSFELIYSSGNIYLASVISPIH